MNLRRMGVGLLLATIGLIALSNFISIDGTIMLFLCSFGFGASLILMVIGGIGPLE